MKEEDIGGECSTHGRDERSRRRYENNIRMDLRNVGWDGVDWIHLAWDRDQ
jgi:hypothetical protein